MTIIHCNMPSIQTRYFGGCIEKGGIGVQLCGWLILLDLCTGGMSGAAYIKADNIIILAMLQKDFAKNGLSLPNFLKHFQ